MRHLLFGLNPPHPFRSVRYFSGGTALKAVQIYEHGGADKLRYEDTADPAPRSPRDVVVRLRAASLNHIDLWNRKGLTGMKVEFPHILGADGAGVVEEAGSEVSHLKKGDAVCLYPPVGCGGCEFCRTSREYMCVRCACWARA